MSRPPTPTPTPLPTRSGGPVPPGVQDGPLARWLQHPGATQRQWWHQLGHALAAQEQHIAAAAGICATVVVAVVLTRRAARRAALRHGHWLHVDPPAQPCADGGIALWRQLAPLLSSRRGLGGARPPVALEWIAEGGRLRVGLWCSRTVGVSAVAEAVHTAWPGAQLTAGDPPALLPRRSARPSLRISCATVRLALPHWYPFSGNEPSTPGHGEAGLGDPLRGLLTALASPPTGSRAVLQILARPATGRAQRRARTAALARRTGAPARATPLSWSNRRPAAATTRGPVDPVALADARAITDKLIDAPLFHVDVRVAVVTPSDRAGRRARTAWLRHVAGALGLYSGRQRLLLTRTRHTRDAINHRQSGRGFLASLREIAAVAHLPAEPSRYGMTVAPARAVAAPADLADA
ncbi:MAG: hypothetical protein ACYCU5_00740 [Actinomycetes bacterium]